MKLLLHACCGPCSLEPVRVLQAAGHDLTIAYANSNIAPAEEYAHRRKTLAKWALNEHLPLAEMAYNPSTWEATAGRIGDAAFAQAQSDAAGAPDKTRAVGTQDITHGDTQASPNNIQNGATGPLDNTLSGIELCATEPARREARCRACYRLRFEETARFALANNFEAIGTTLSVSPYQFTHIIQEELEKAALGAGLHALFDDYRPFYDTATQRSRELGMYRQNYCGCRFSDAEAAAERAIRKRQRIAKRAAKRAKQEGTPNSDEAARSAKQAEKQALAAKRARRREVLQSLRNQETTSK